MRPISLVEAMKSSYQSYIRTTFPVADDKLRSQMHALLEEVVSRRDSVTLLGAMGERSR